MRVLISADMEGATGVTWTDDCVAGTEPWQRMRRMFTGDVNACVAGLVAGGATDVLVNESHSAQRNLLLEELDERARMLTGRHKPLSMMQGIDSGPDAVVFLGYHAMAGAQGVLAHTWLENAITQVRLDGTPVGEGGLNAAVAAEHGVPVVLVTGDDRACAEAGGYAPDAVTVAVKECVSRYAAICLPPARSAALLRAGAEVAMAKAGRHAPRPGRHRVEIDFDAAHLADAAAVVPTVTRPGPCTVAVEAESMTAVYRAFKIVATVAASAMQAVYG